MNRILVIGATGNVGRQVLSQLPATGVRVRALARNPDTAGLPPHVEVVRGDLTLPETLDGCLDGIDAVFLVWTAPPAAVAPALERIAKHARRIVFLSSPYKTAHPFFQGGQPNPVSALHAEIERLSKPQDASGRSCGPECSPRLPCGGGRRGSAPAAMSCAGPMSPLLQLRSTSVTSPRSRSAPCARMDTPERNMF